ncbi:hypothetical protein IAR50_004575 [Cryptococcus sp. DSM 104548]
MDQVNHIQLTVHPSQVRAVLRGLLLAIFFHRNLDAMEAETFELLDSYISCSTTPSMQKDISNSIEEFAIRYVEGGESQGEMALVFLSKKAKRGWFAVTEELVPWEEHLITLSFETSKPTINPISAALMQITTYCLQHKDQVPPLTGSSDNASAPYRILVEPASPVDLFSPASPPPHPMRLTSPPPAPLTTATPATATAQGLTMPSRPSSAIENISGNSMRRGLSPASARLGYLEQAKDGLRAVSAKAGAGVGWSGRAMGAAFGK